ncbi:MAG: hypothetical protein J4473_04675 [Candidatus Aenigmarchaeota archaeon]|nr:hypothetical protein [Candidatus Aenigmarchaeota archaeon]
MSKLFQCSECSLFYKNKFLAEKCRKWCAEHKSCNLEIIKHAVKKSLLNNAIQ